jgi:hypothetical protein
MKLLSGPTVIGADVDSDQSQLGGAEGVLESPILLRAQNLHHSSGS